MHKKTIAITLGSAAAFRNLFFFPGSVFEQLRVYAKKNNIRILVCITPKDYEKYQPIINPDGEYVCYEKISVAPARRSLERVFYFFYSYLVYTGTTKVLATMAIRPDEPPAGGKSYLVFLKWTISRFFGWSRFLKRNVIPFLFHKIFIERPFRDTIESYQPDLMVSTHIYGWFDTQFLREAKAQGIKTIGMPAGWDHLDKYFLPFHPDTLLVPSKELSNAAVKYQAYAKFEIQIVGYAHFDFILNPEIQKTRDEVLRFLNFPPHAKYLLYVSGSAYCPDEPDIIETLLQWFEEKQVGDEDVYLVIRPYLGGRGKDREFDEKKFNRFKTHPRVYFFDKPLWNDVENSASFINIMRYADVVLGMYTTIVLEASVFDRPLIAAGFDGYTTRPMKRSIRRFEYLEHFKDVLKTGALPTAYNFSELQELLKLTLADPHSRSHEREKLRHSLAGVLDGASSRRIVDALINAL